MQLNYEVIRFVGQNGKYHIVMDCVEGELLSNYLQKHEAISKKFFLSLITNIAKELEGLEASNATEYIPYLTPFHIVIKDDQSVALMKYNEKHNKRIEKILECFTPDDGSVNYYYSYGRVLQYILMKMKLRPRLSKMEEFRIRRTITKCLVLEPKKQYKNVKELLARLRFVKKRKRGFTVVAVVVAILLLTALGVRKNIVPEPVNLDPYEQLVKYMEGDLVWSEVEVERLLKEYEAEQQEEFGLAEREWIMSLCYQLNTDYARQQLKTHGEIILAETIEMKELLANIYIEEGELETAIRKYQLLVLEDPSAERYMALANLLAQRNRHAEALATCKAACELFPEREELQLSYVKYLYLDEKISEEEKTEKIEEFISSYPMLKESEAFMRLEDELGIIWEVLDE